MIRKIRLKNLSLIDDIEITFGSGLNVITGETGSGKTVFIKTLLAAFGMNSFSDLVKEDQISFVEVILDPVSEDEKIVEVRRESQPNKKIKNMYNGVPVSIEKIRSIVEDRLIVHSQNQTVTLLKKSNQQRFFDFQSKEIANYLDRYLKKREEILKLKDRIEKLRKIEDGISKTIAEINEFIEDCTKAGIHPGIESELKKKREILKNKASVLEAVSLALNLLKENEFAATTSIGKTIQELKKVEEILEIDSSIIQQLEEAQNLILDVSASLNGILSDLDITDVNLDEIEEKLFEIQRIKKKYGIELHEDLGKELEKKKSMLQEISSHKEELEQLQILFEEKYRELEDIASKLSIKRTEFSQDFSRRINSILKELKMGDQRFNVRMETIKENEDYQLLRSPHGFEYIYFEFQTEDGDFQPISKIASGGELSRLMLALETFDQSTSQRKTYVFDEVDTGIGGKTAVSLGRYLLELSTNHQVIVITHLPQIAAFAGKHFMIEKSEERGEKIKIRELTSKQERVQEIARMLSGGLASNQALKHAEELLLEAGEVKIEN
ncbi:MAG: hypothetical protein N2440_05505 [Actinobacteria bacterium]|nr:hypothetical protein [Actinomycetota bacterium]